MVGDQSSHENCSQNFRCTPHPEGQRFVLEVHRVAIEYSKPQPSIYRNITLQIYHFTQHSFAPYNTYNSYLLIVGRNQDYAYLSLQNHHRRPQSGRCSCTLASYRNERR